MGTLAPTPLSLHPVDEFWGLVWGLWDTGSEAPPHWVPPAWGLGSHWRPGQGPRSWAGMRAVVEGGVKAGLGWALVFLPLLVSMSLSDKTLNDFCLL